MNLLKGFVTIGDLVNNTSDSTAPIGELSTFGRTFTRDLGLYELNAYPKLTLISSVYTINDVASRVPTEITNSIFKIVSNFLNLNLSVNTSQSDLRVAYAASFTENAATEESNVLTGEAIQAIHSDSTSFMMPIWISYNYTTGGVTTFIKVWLSNEAYTNEFTDYSIEVISPLEVNQAVVTTSNSLNIFVDGSHTYQQLQDLIVKDTAEFIDVINARVNRQPCSFIKTIKLPFTYGGNSTTVLQLEFTLLIYGPAGNNTDAINDAITTYIAAHLTEGIDTTYAQLFRLYFPDIYTNTEFTFLPRWDLTITTGSALLGAIYKSVTKETNGTASNWKKFTDLFGKDGVYSKTSIVSNIGSFNLLYKGLLAHVCGSDINRTVSGHTTRGLLDMFPDFSFCYRSDPIFERLSAVTQDLVLAIHTLILYADTVTPTTVLPEGYFRLIRDFPEYQYTSGTTTYTKAAATGLKFVGTKVMGPDNKLVSIVMYCRDQS